MASSNGSPGGQRSNISIGRGIRVNIKWCVFTVFVCLCVSQILRAQIQPASLPDAPKPQTGIIVGTVTDADADPVAGASVALAGATLDEPRTVKSDDNGAFKFDGVAPGTYLVTVNATGFASWTSSALILKPGQYAILPGTKLRVATERTTINVTPLSSVEIAKQQVKAEEQQRILGFIPNFYIAYGENVSPLTTKLKFQLAAKVSFDPVTIAGVGLFAGMYQAADRPDYRQGWAGFGERYGALYADGFTDIMVGGAILPSLLHQDPRYFYRGTGTKKSRTFYAITRTFVCKGDNGHWQPNYSTMGGDLASASVANAYYPASNRGAGLFLTNFFINTGQRTAANLAQEFILRKFTTKAKDQH